MKKRKVLSTGIMAAFVAAALSGCDSQPEEMDSFTINTQEQCVTAGAGSAEQCATAWQEAEAEHKKEALSDKSVQYASQQSCETGNGVQCQKTQVQHSDGSFSDVFIPMMAGMFVGNMIGNMMAPKPQPVYMTRDREYSTRGGYVVPYGRSTVSKSAFTRSSSFTKPHSYASRSYTPPAGAKPMASASKPVAKSGGFGSSARGSSVGG